MLRVRARLSIAVLSALVAAGLVTAATPAAALSASASVTVVHGLADVVADVALDGTTVLTGFEPDRSTEPMAVPAGTRRIEVRRSTDPAGPALIAASIEFAAGQSQSLVLHRDAAGQPVLTSFRNELAAVPAGGGRLVLHNTAVLPTAQLVVDGQPVGAAATSGSATSFDLPAGPHTVAVRDVEGTQFLLDNRTVQVPADASTLLYLVGSPEDDSLDWMVQTLDVSGAVLGGVPIGGSGPGAFLAGVPAGDSGLKDRPADGTRVSALVLLTAVTVTIGTARLRRRRA